MSENTGTATGPGPDDDEGLEPADAVPAGALASTAASSSVPVKTEDGEKKVGRIRGIGVFYRQVVAELRKVVWPTRRELVTYTSVVLVFVAVMVAIVSVFDFAFGRAVLEVFGDSSL